MRTLALFALFVLFCSTQAYYAKLDKYEESLQTWKRIQPRTYNYRSTTEIWAPGFESTNYTDITVTDGKVVKRTYTYTNGIDVLGTWVEDTPEEIGSHDQGFKALTLDQLYSQCRENVLVYDDVIFTITFETDGNGVMTQCNARSFLYSHPYVMGIQLDYVALE